MATPQHTYELTYIINAALSDEQIKDMVGRVQKYIEDNGGEITDVDEWGNRRLAYPINKKRNGYYVNLYFRGPGELIPRLERAMKIEDNLLRYLTLRMDPKMVRHYEQNKQKRVEAGAEA